MIYLLLILSIGLVSLIAHFVFTGMKRENERLNRAIELKKAEENAAHIKSLPIDDLVEHANKRSRRDNGDEF